MRIAAHAVVEWARWGEVSKEELGASRNNTRNGSLDDEATSEAEAFSMAKKFLSYIPPNVDQLPPRTVCKDPATRTAP